MGFEPTVPIARYDDLANRSFRPLRHLSITVNVASIAQRATYILGVGLAGVWHPDVMMYQLVTCSMIDLDLLSGHAAAVVQCLLQCVKEFFEHCEDAVAPYVALDSVWFFAHDAIYLGDRCARCVWSCRYMTVDCAAATKRSRWAAPRPCVACVLCWHC